MEEKKIQGKIGEKVDKPEDKKIKVERETYASQK